MRFRFATLRSGDVATGGPQGQRARGKAGQRCRHEYSQTNLQEQVPLVALAGEQCSERENGTNSWLHAQLSRSKVTTGPTKLLRVKVL
jgi:hypothetical protein